MNFDDGRDILKPRRKQAPRTQADFKTLNVTRKGMMTSYV